MLEFLKPYVHHFASWSARIVLLALITLAPWFYAGAQWQFQLWLVYTGLLLAALTTVAVWTNPQKQEACIGPLYLLVGLLGICFVQQLTLPRFLVPYASIASRVVDRAIEDAKQISQRSPEALDKQFWLAKELHRTLSIQPEQTRASMAVLSVAIVAVWSASVLFVTPRWAVILAIAIGACGLGNAFLGLVQMVSWNGWTLLEMPFKSYFSTFVSRNSAPAFFASATGSMCALLGIAFRNNKRKRREEFRVTYPSQSWHGRLRSRMEDAFIDLDTTAIVCISSVAFMLVSTLATASRGGVIASFAACFVTLSLMMGSRGGMTRALSIVAVMAVLVIGMLSYYELDSNLLKRMEELNQQAHTGSDGRLVIWGCTLNSLKWYWMAGCGLGTYRFAILPFHDRNPGSWFHHAENIPLEIVTELGLPGLMISCAVFVAIVKKIRWQSYAGEEKLLLAAAMFSTVALAIQGLFDFSLILPGVFLPYAALIGAFLGRCQIIEAESGLRREFGDASHDARRLAKMPKPYIQWRRAHWVGHAIVALTCTLASLVGLRSLSALAAAERMESIVKVEERDAGERTIQSEKLSELLTDVAPYAGHPEVELQSGRVLRLLWSAAAMENIAWEREVDSATRLKLTLPSTMRAALSEPSNPIELWLHDALLQDKVGIGLAQQSFDRFANSVRRNPFDTRALWGALRGDLDWLSPFSRTTMRGLLKKNGSNNPEMLANAGVIAIRKDSFVEGRILLKRAIELNQHQADKLQGILHKINASQLLEMIPDDPVVLARTARALSTDENWPKFKDDVLASVVLAKATARTLEDWLSLAWVAENVSDNEAHIAKLRGALGIAPGRSDVRFRLAEALKKDGKLREGIEELKRISRFGSSQYDGTLKEWQTLDQ